MTLFPRLVSAAVGITFLSTIGGCNGKPIPLNPTQELYAGKWTAADGTFVHLYLDGAGDAKTSRGEIKGGRVQFDPTSFTIGRGWQRERYTIDRSPQRQQNQWILTLNGVDYVRALSPKEIPIAAALPPAAFQAENTFAGRVERQLQTGFLERTSIPIHSVTCPIALEARVGNQFTCRLVATDGSILEATVTPTDDQGNISWNAPQGILSLSTLEKGIQTNLRAQSGKTTRVTCGGKPFKIAQKAEKFLCEATFPDSQTKQIEVSVLDDRGNVRWKID